MNRDNREFSRTYYDLDRSSSRKNILGRSPSGTLSKGRPVSRSNSIRAPSSRSTQSSYNVELLLNDGEVFPQDVLMLLGDEQRNIVDFKNRIEAEKSRVQSDFTNLKHQLNHIVDDLKISVQAQLDNIYRLFIEKYACLKSEVQDIRRIKKQIQWQSPNPHLASVPTLSNRQLIKELEQDSNNYKIFKAHNYITEIQKKKLSPLLDLSRELILLGTTNSTFYKSDITVKQLKELKSTFSHFTSHMFSGLANYVIGPQVILEKLNEKSDQNSYARDEDFQQSTKDKEISRPVASFAPPVITSVTLGHQPRPNLESEYITKVCPPPVRTLTTHNSEYDLFPASQPVFSRPTYSPASKVRISPSGQGIASSWVEDVRVNQLNTITTGHQQKVLCAAIIKGTHIATGGKDSLINVYTLEGVKIATLRAHTSSICTIGVLNSTDSRPIMMSGGDLGCNTVVLWDTSTWTVRAKILAHTAAVTSLLDLCDGQTMVSGSFDKKLNIINFNRAEVMYNMPVNKQSVTGVVLNSTRTKMISSGITQTESSLSVWNIVRRQQSGVVEMISLQRVIANQNRIYSMVSSMVRSSLVVTGLEDGRIKLWNIDSGECQKSLTVNNNPILELVLVERDSKPNFPIILSCCSKDKSLILTRTQTSINSLFEVNNKLNVKFGCGVGPKIIFDRSRTLIMALVSQADERREVTIFEVDIK